MTVPDPKPYMGVRDCALLLGVSREIVYRLIHAGDLQAIRTPGGHRRILRSSADALRLRQGTGPALREAQRLGLPCADDTGPQMSVLLVDDELVSLTWLKHTVSREFPQVRLTTAQDTDSAFAAMEQTGCPDVVVTDLNMPGDGFKLVWAIHVRPEYQRALVIATTALDASEIRAAGGLPERVIQLAKPVQPTTLVGLLQAALLLRAHLRARIH
jgi:excisionase family DNA binding protein